MTPAASGPSRANLDGGSRAPSRTAAIGGTWVAFSAGRSAASRVTATPTASDTTIVLVASTVAAWGRSMPNDLNSELSPFASPMPTSSPAAEASSPITSASSITVRRTWRLVAPSVRSVASSRVRCAIVIDSVLAITKLPTNNAIPAKASRKFWMMLRKPLVSWVAFLACEVPVRASALGGSRGRISRSSWAEV